MLAIITGTIKPNCSMEQLVIKNEEERLRQYIDSITFFIKSEAFSKIIFCDNSNYNIDNLEFLRKRANENNVELEILSFQGNIKKISYLGKGYGEGEIMNYIFEHSKIAQEEDYFVKITGRIRVDNIKEIVSKIKKNKTYFNIPNYTIKDIYDTRIYAMPIKQFRELFLREFIKVKDDKGIYLEYVYTDILERERIRISNFPRYPRIIGVSGSTGTVYGYTEWKCKVKDILSLGGFYKVRKKL